MNWQNFKEKMIFSLQVIFLGACTFVGWKYYVDPYLGLGEDWLNVIFVSFCVGVTINVAIVKLFGMVFGPRTVIEDDDDELDDEK